MTTPTPKPWKGVIYSCCGVYGRIYFQEKRGVWTGNCPKCLKPVVLKNPEYGY